MSDLIAAVWTRRANGDWRISGSGYLIGNGLVLTAAHVTDGRPARVQLLQYSGALGEPLDCTTAWTRLDNACDATLLRITADHPGSTQVRWGRLTSRTPAAACTAVGYPLFNDEDGEAAAEQISGRINPATLASRGRYAVDLHAWPRHLQSRGSAWRGMSGAALVAGRHVIGVIRFDETEFEGRRLSATPAATLLADSGFAAILHDAALATTAESVELTELVRPVRRLSTRGSPAALLRPECAAVPFYGRADELTELARWCDEGWDDTIRVGLVVGAGGQGKTRLAYELAYRQGRQGWVCGILNTAQAAEQTPFQLLRDNTEPVLLLLDYAETRVEHVRRLVTTLTDVAPTRPVRLLLLARSAGDWWLQLRRSDELLTEVLPARPTIALAPMEPTIEGRARAFRDAVHALVERLAQRSDLSHRTPASVALPNLSGDAYGRILTIQIAAFATLLEVDGRDPIDGPAQRLVDHERRYWDRVADQRGIGHRSTRERAVAALLLQRPDDVADATALVGRAMPDVRAEYERRDIAGWVHALYPPEDDADGYLGGLHPDLVMEYFIGELLRSETDLLADIVPGVGHDAAVRMLTQLSRAADHPEFFPGLGRRVGELIMAHPRELAVAAAVVAPSARHPQPMADALSEILAQEQDPELISAIDRVMPEQSLALAKPAVEVALRKVDSLDRAMAAGAAGLEPALAASLRKLATQLANTDRHGAAADAAIRALDIYRELATTEPERYALDMIESGAVAAVELAAFGTYSMATTLIQEALRGYTNLPSRTLRHRPVGARLLSANARILQGIGDDEQSTFMFGKAIRSYGELYRDDPRGYREPLAAVLADRAELSSEVGEPSAAIADLDRAARLYRDLREEWPDRYDVALASTMHRTAVALLIADQDEEAYELARRAVDYLQALPKENFAAYRTLLAQALVTNSAAALRCGDELTALGAAEEAVKLADPDADNNDGDNENSGSNNNDEDRPVSWRTVALTKCQLADCLGATGDFDGAVAKADDAVAGLRLLGRSATEGHLPMLAKALNTQVRWLIAAGDTDGALPLADEAAELTDVLSDQSQSRYLDTWASALANYARCLALSGNGPEAATVAGVAASAWHQIVEVRGLRRHRAELADVLTDLAGYLAEAGFHANGLPLLKQAFLIRSDLAAEHPDRNVTALLHSALALARLSWAAGKPNGAGAFYAHSWQLASDAGFYRITDELTAELPALFTQAPAALADGWRTQTGTLPPAWLLSS